MSCIHLFLPKHCFCLLASLSVCQLLVLKFDAPASAEFNSLIATTPQNQAIAQTKPPTDNTQNAAPVEVPISIKRIDIVGSTILTPNQIDQLTSPLIGKSTTISQISEIADKITKIYQENNFITSRAFLPPQDIKDGVVKIQVLEGKIERIDIGRAGKVDGRLNDNYIRDRIALGATHPLNFTNIEEKLQLLRADPLVADIKANLISGSTPDQNIVNVTLSEAKTFSVNTFIDNYGNTSSGIFRVGATVQEANLTGNGDSIYLSYTRSGSSDNYSLGYFYPINPMGGTLGFNFSTGQSPVTEPPFNTLNISTNTQTFELAYRQPIVRSLTEEFTLGVGFTFGNSSSFLDGESFNFQNLLFDDGNSQTRVLNLNQEYIRRDNSGAWALRSSFNFGLGMLGATIRNDNSPDGRFFYWVGQLLRVQRLGEDKDTLATFRFNLQLAGDSLLSSNRFSIGGPQSVRGYRQSQLVGDNGIQSSLEIQIPVVRDLEGIPIVKVLPFMEAGAIWNARNNNFGNQSLLGIGLGAIYQPSRNFTFRLDYGIPLINAGNPYTNLQDSGMYFSVSGNF